MPGDHEPVLIDDPASAPEPERDTTRPAWLLPVGAAAATLAVGAALGLTTHRTPSEPAPAPATAAARPGIPPTGPAGLIVRDGDLVEASGPVDDEVMCSPGPVPAIIDPPCTPGIRVPGIKPTRGATLRGRWHPNGLSDIQRMPYSPPSTGLLGEYTLPDTPPCAAPAGGWSQSEDWLHKGLDGPVDDYLSAHADQFAEPFATHVGNARIQVVRVVRGDVDQARKALTAIYTENLCVVAAPGGHSIAAEARLQATTGEAVGALMADRASGIYTTSPENGRIRVNMVQLTQPLYDKLAAIGLDDLIIDPWIRPAAL
ncbi:hypothetical protein [Spirilliplanes yamanashiensis]|uniref:Uncharacterized protein n=1 Tax=Spirilliplanes yamanashiensis TaxID=42233 RepID=A0A8J4DM13_9ACTN|nr:hypothetical protein [Spirilliplanes yamanashiensis]MDP9818332.1 hypothetical protein [Spirilliplanes yamanashiensis]GIJ06551.1 hypothetical protein Sya03_59030 [Spirilliplanes yamanashiensis]